MKTKKDIVDMDYQMPPTFQDGETLDKLNLPSSGFESEKSESRFETTLGKASAPEKYIVKFMN